MNVGWVFHIPLEVGESSRSDGEVHSAYTDRILEHTADALPGHIALIRL